MGVADNKTTIQELKDNVLAFIQERNWLEHQKPRDLSISICLEAAELLELFQWNDRNDEDSLKADDTYQLLEDELADVLIYCLSIANAMNIDIAACITQKMEKNAVKYPVNNSIS